MELCPSFAIHRLFWGLLKNHKNRWNGDGWSNTKFIVALCVVLYRKGKKQVYLWKFISIKTDRLRVYFKYVNPIYNFKNIIHLNGWLNYDDLRRNKNSKAKLSFVRLSGLLFGNLFKTLYWIDCFQASITSFEIFLH